MAKIGFDGSRLAVAEPTGTESYSAEILKSLADIAGNELIVYLNGTTLPPHLELPAHVQLRSIPFPRLWTHGRLALEMTRHPPDVLFVPAHVIPIRHPATVVTVHDLGYLLEPSSHPRAARLHLDLTTRWSVRAASAVIAVSDSTKQALVGAYRVDPAKIRVVHHGISPRFRRVGTDEIARVRRRYGLPEHFVLTVGTIQPRKNLARLVAAMDLVRSARLPHQLVIAGRDGWLSRSVHSDIAKSNGADLVHLLGYVFRSDLPALYSAADAFAFPSLYEGFGLPLLEAFACGVPAVVSDRGALPEVAGGAAVVVEATSVGKLGAALQSVVTDRALRHRLVDRGLARAAKFGWDRAAAQTLDVLRQARSDAKP